MNEGIATYMVGAWPDDDEHLMRELVAAGHFPALSQLSGSGGFANARLNDALGHARFDYIENRWGPTSIRRFLQCAHRPARRQDLRRRVGFHAGGIRRGFPAIHRTPLQASRSLTFRGLRKPALQRV